MLPRHHFSFFPGMPADQSTGLRIGIVFFLDAARRNLEGQAQRLQQLDATRRGRRQD